ncbi:MAG: hypothetical protein KAS66_02055 [Candidatus Omnitrophica bacterium]|nr:hypothetical protein [Candidatus Omnitrophota bacterium]
MSTVFNTSIAMFIPLGIGLSLILIIFRKSRLGPSLSLALAYGLGLGVLTLWMVFLTIVDIPFTVMTTGLPILAAMFTPAYICRKKTGLGTLLFIKQMPNDKRPLDLIVLLLLAYVTFYMMYVFWTALNIPVHVWDEIERVAFKAKIFYTQRSIMQLKYLPHPSYPVLIELAVTWLTLNLQSWNDQVIKIIIPFFFLFYSIIHFSFLKNFTNTRWALGGVALLAVSPLLIHHATMLYVDLPLMFYNCSAIILLLIWDMRKEDSYLFLASLFAGLASFTKVEGAFYFIIYFILLIFLLSDNTTYPLKKKVRSFVKFAIPCLTIFLFFFLYKAHAEITLVERAGYDFSLENLNRLPVIIEAFIRNLFLSGNWSIVWLILILSIVHIERIIKIKQVRLLLLCLLLYFGILFVIFLMTPIYYWISYDKAYGVLARLILHFYPISALLIILLNCPLSAKNATS